jgi:hypothetical protein
MTVLGLAHGSFQLARDHANNLLAPRVSAYAMQDEARHVAFRRL